MNFSRRLHRAGRLAVRQRHDAIAAAVLILAGVSLTWWHYASPRNGDVVETALDARDGTLYCVEIGQYTKAPPE